MWNWKLECTHLKTTDEKHAFHRLALSKDKKRILQLSQSGSEIYDAKDIIKDPYVFEFLGIPQQHHYLEGDLEKRLIDNLEHFLLELGQGFAFVGRQYKITLANRHFYVDLVFYHRILKCFVLIDLKQGEVEHNDIGQMNLYLNYFTKEESVAGDNPPIGLVLGTYNDHVLVEYALAGISNQLFVSKYMLYLPDKEKLIKELNKILENPNG